MGAGQIKLKYGTAPGTPAFGKAALYPKSDKKWYAKDDDGLETPLLSTPPPAAYVKGDGTILVGNSGIVSSVRNGVGDYSVMLADPLTPTDFALPMATLQGADGMISCDLATPPPCTQINVSTLDTTGAPADAKFCIALIHL